MAKHSIFSRDYERTMRRKRRKSILIILAVVLIIVISFIKFEVINMDFSNFRQRVQAWVDSEKTPDELSDAKQEEVTKVATETPKTIEKTYMDLKVSDVITLKAEYKEENGNKKFINIDQATGITGIISPLGTQILTTDANQNLKVFNVDGTMKDITKLAYVSQSGVSYPKDNILKSTPSYIWHSQAKFIDETKVIYVSQLPYFGAAAVNRYLWIVDINTGTDKALWNLLGADTTIGNVEATKGICVTVNGQKYFVTGDGNYTSEQTPVQQAPVQQAPVEQAPVEQAPVQ